MADGNSDQCLQQAGANATQNTAPLCAVCGDDLPPPVLDLGLMPLVDRFEAPDTNETPCYPLRLHFCESCALAQLGETPAAETLFDADYRYLSSVSAAWLNHARKFAAREIDRLDLGPDDLVVEIASNDGYLLRWFHEAQIEVVGFEPTPIAANIARGLGIDTRGSFFTRATGKELRREKGKGARLVVGNNVLAHVPDPSALLASVADLIAPEGVASFEFPYLGDLVAGCAFDTIYHEHLCYFSLTAIERLAKRAGLKLVDVERLATHGGSLRVRLMHARAACDASDASIELLAQEQVNGLADGAILHGFANKVEQAVRALRAQVCTLQAAGKRIAAYGAAAKGTILLKAAGLDHRHLDFVVDKNPAKHGLVMPGSKLGIQPADQLAAMQPDYCLLLSWNWAQEIMAEQSDYQKAGGKFILPLPDCKLI